MKYIKAFDYILDTIGDTPQDCKTSDMRNNYQEVCDTLLVIRNYYGLFRNLETKAKEVYFDNYDNEIWKPVIGCEDIYEVSNMVRVRNAKTKKILKPFNRKGYHIYMLYFDKKLKAMRLCRMVASAFVTNPDNKPFVDHINANSLDDRPQNLKWVTHKENMNNKITKENVGNSHGSPVLQYNLDGEFVHEWANSSVAVKANGWPVTSSKIIANCCKKQNYSKTYKKFIWKYQKDVPYEKRYIKQDDIDYYLNSHSVLRKVSQYSLENVFIADYESSVEAARQIGMSNGSGIRNCCDGKCKNGSYKGFIWKWKNEVTK